MIRLICLDMEGVLVEHRNFWLDLHKAWGTWEEGSELTEKYLLTEYGIPTGDALDKLWIGKSYKEFNELIESSAYMKGIEEFFSELDSFQQGEHQYFSHESRVPRAIISSGPYQLATRIKERFGVDFIFGNELVFEDSVYRGKYHFNMMSGDEFKSEVMHQLCDDLDVLPQEALYIGDDSSDLHVFREVGFSIAFGTKNKELKEAATFVVDSNDLRDVIPVLREIKGIVHQED